MTIQDIKEQIDLKKAEVRELRKQLKVITLQALSEDKPSGRI